MSLSLDTTITLNNGTEMPQLGLGVFQSEAGSETENAVRYALEAGYRHIDTAAIYRNERAVGNIINAGIVPREDVFVTSKLWTNNFTYADAKRGFEETMEKLNLEYLDLYLIHWPTSGWQEAYPALEEFYNDGRIKAIGVSNFLTHHLTEILENSSVPPAVNQYEMHPYLQQPELRQLCQDNNIAITAWAPIMKGRVLDVPELVSIGETHNKSAVQVALRWLLQLGVIAIPKSVNQNRIVDNADLYDFELSDDEMTIINGLDKHERTGPDPDTFGK